jgi:hypothetical protein
MPGEWEILNLGKFKENQMTLEQVKEQKLNVRFFIKDEVQE